MKIEHIVLDEKCNVTLDAYIQDTEGEYRSIIKRPAVIVIPGGGYMFCSDREAEPVAFKYIGAGYDAFILRYSLNEDAIWPKPLLDYEQAYSYIEAHAKEWKINMDKIAVCGFSAGGHLAGAIATMAEHKPAAAILGYPVLAETVDEILPGAPYIYQKVDKDTAPCFIFGSCADSVVAVDNLIKMQQSLADNKITFETHIYPFGPHGFSTGEDSIQGKSAAFCERIPHWVEDSIGFLQDLLGKFKADQQPGDNKTGMEEPVCKSHIVGDGEAWLSADCSIGRVFGNPKAVEEIDEYIKVMKEYIEPFTPEQSFEDMMNLMRNMKLKDILMERHVPVDISELNKVLNKIPNI